MVRDLTPASLLSIPTEIRLKIFELSIDNSTVHVSEDGAVSCIHDRVLWSYARRHTCEAWRYASGLILTSRQSFHESIGILYSKTTLAFECPEALSNFFKNRQIVLPYVQHVSIHCGPAKHTTNVQKTGIRIALELLRNRAPRLNSLWIRLCSYKDIQNDRNLLSNFWLYHLSRLRMLKKLCLEIQPDLPGPVLFDWKEELSHDRIDEKILNTVSVLQQLNTIPVSVPESPSRNQLLYAEVRMQGHTRIIPLTIF